MAWSDLPSKPNVVVIISDQQRFPQHFPSGWTEANLPAMKRLLDTGMSFTNCFSAACECSPSRGTFVTSTFDDANHVFTTPPGQSLNVSLGNLATVFASAGYQVVWKGKWHLFGPRQPQTAATVAAYGFTGWDPPDAGTTLSTSLLGGGVQDNDGRFVSGAVEFLRSAAAQQPFCLVVSLVNPHDVHVYTQGWAQKSVGYPASIPDMGVGLPGNQDDPLTEKPSAQLAFRTAFDTSPNFRIDPVKGLSPAGYVNFYAYLQTVVDARVGAVLDALDDAKLTDKTLVVRMGDHGEMGMSHGLREKMYIAYDEAIRVPFVVSNPLVFDRGPVETAELASLLDLAPTLATAAGAKVPSSMKGKDLAPLLSGQATSVQDAVLYAYDDVFNLDDAQVATHIRAVRTAGNLYSIYFSETSPDVPMEFELYDLASDPGQLVNLLAPQHFEPKILPLWAELTTTLMDLVQKLGAQPQKATLPTPAQLEPRLLEATGRALDLAAVAGEPWTEGK